MFWNGVALCVLRFLLSETGVRQRKKMFLTVATCDLILTAISTILAKFVNIIKAEEPAIKNVTQVEPTSTESYFISAS